jgi:hypothetical protein
MSRIAPPALLGAALSVLSLTAPDARSQDAAVPSYFFNEWRVSRDCSEPHAAPAGHTQTGLRLRVTPSADGFALETIDAENRKWSSGWSGAKLEYRAGTPLAAVPADFECVPGEEASSPFLAMGGHSVSAEPWYENEHWYGLLKIHGQAHHVLIFPIASGGGAKAVIVLQDADASDNIELDHDGTIIIEA